MTDDERRMLTELHTFLMRPTAPGKPSRAQMIDDALGALKAGKWSVRAVIFLASTLVLLSGAYATIRGYWPK